MGLRGPRSALSQFLEEENIRIAIDDHKKESNIEQPSEKNQNLTNLSIQKPKRVKKLKFSHPTEIINISDVKTLKQKVLEKIHANIFQFKLSDTQIEEYSLFLLKNLCLTQDIFNHIANCSKERFIAYDCSMITEFDHIRSLKHLHLGYCGQLRNKDMTEILQNNKELESLYISGAFLLENLDISQHRKLKYISVRECSRLKNNFIDHLNIHDNLELLDISHCFGLMKKAQLRLNVKCLRIDRVNITQRFFKHIDVTVLEELSISNCPRLFKDGKNILRLKKFKSLKILNIEGISEIKTIKIKCLETLKAANCFSLTLSTKYKNFKHLDISNINLSLSELQKIFTYKHLKYLNISFNRSVDDQFVLKMLKTSPKIKKIIVFGCFLLTKELGKLAWQIKDTVKIIGNHAETKFLLEN